MSLLHCGGQFNDPLKKSLVITLKMQHYLSFYLSYGEILAGIPFQKVNSKAVVASPMRLGIWTLNMGASFLYAGYVTIRTLQVLLDPLATNPEKMYMELMTILWLTSVSFQMALVLNPNLMPEAINQVVAFGKAFEDRYALTGQKLPLLQKISETAVQMYFFMGVGCCSMTVLNAFLRPHSADFLSSLFHMPNPLSIRILSSLQMTHASYLYAVNSSLLVTYILLSVTVVVAVTKEISVRKCKFTKNKLRSPFRVLQIYQQLRLITNLLNHVANSVAIPCYKYLGIALIILCVYGGIRIEGVYAFYLAFLGTCHTGIVLCQFSFLAEIHFQSSKLLGEWKNNFYNLSKNQLLRQCVRSSPAIKAVMGGQYYVDKQMILHLLMIIMTNTIGFLLANN